MELLTHNALQRGIILRDWWGEVKENFWETDARPKMRQLLKDLMEQTMLEELEVFLKSEYAPEEGPYRNGYYARGLVTQLGTIEAIAVPRLRESGFQTKVFSRYKRYQPLVEDVIAEAFLGGVSTRRVGEVLEALLECKVSSTKVSRVTRRLDGLVRQFHRRKLIDEYQYLIVDGITLKIRHGGKYHNRKVLAVYGITVFGKREMIDFVQSKGESQNAWESLLMNLFNRGLEGKTLRLIAMDGSSGLRAACELVFPQAKIQRCWAHKMRNVASYCKKKYEGPCVKQAQKIYLAETKRAAHKAFNRWKTKWLSLCPKAVRCLEKDLEELLNFLDCPKAHQIKIRTTNVIERAFREVRRRTRVMTCFSNKASCERIIYAIMAHLNKNWKAGPLKDFTQFN
jgi:putative transposase